MTAGNLSRPETRQADLFADQGRARDRELDRLTDAVNQRFGHKLRRGLAADRQGDDDPS